MQLLLPSVATLNGATAGSDKAQARSPMPDSIAHILSDDVEQARRGELSGGVRQQTEWTTAAHQSSTATRLSLARSDYTDELCPTQQRASYIARRSVQPPASSSLLHALLDLLQVYVGVSATIIQRKATSSATNTDALIFLTSAALSLARLS